MSSLRARLNGFLASVRGNAALPSRVADGETGAVTAPHSQPQGDSGTDLDEVQGDQVSGGERWGFQRSWGGPGRLTSSCQSPGGAGP